MASHISPATSRDVLTTVQSHMRPATAFIHTTPHERDPNALPGLINDVTNLLTDFQRVEPLIPPPAFARLLLDLRHLHEQLEYLQSHLSDVTAGAPAPPGQAWESLPMGGRKLVLDIELLQEMASVGMEDEEMAEHLLCSRRTVVRRRQEANITKREYSTISDDDLALYIHPVLKYGSGKEGEKGVHTGLKEFGLKIKRSAVRRVLQTIDRGQHFGSAFPVVRRIYRVPWINSLWHIDGHHKLIPWKIVVHGCIDGFSRMITFMRASDNNRADTVFQCFQGAVERYGWPSRMRADYGKENWDVKAAMEEVRGSNRGSFIQGPSMRNQRIERLWVDVQKWCTAKYREVFLSLETAGVLNVDNPFQLWALHFCYLPMINSGLDFFTNRWNIHGLRTMRNNSPSLIWLRNRLQAARLGIDPLENPLALLDENDVDLEPHQLTNFADYGVDDLGVRANQPPLASDPYVEVEPLLSRVPPNVGEFMISTWLREQMEAVAGPPWPILEDFGTERYLRVIEALDNLIRENFPDL